VKSSASFSPCKKYRWHLSRYITNSKKELIFIGLNPSLADARHNDPTLRRLIAFSKIWGYGSLVVINLFARISKSPKLLASCIDPVGWKNDFELQKRINYWSRNHLCDLWIGWGANGKLMNRNEILIKKLKESSKQPCVIGLTKEGHPKHPLYISKQKNLFHIDLQAT
tara:strand:- start:56 stop:559 length:504 start_codon:yes stop_codon:yes gene_type:complete